MLSAVYSSIMRNLFSNLLFLRILKSRNKHFAGQELPPIAERRKQRYKLERYSLITVLILAPMTEALAFGESELELCTDITDTLKISTYTKKLQEYLTDKTGVVPAWLAAKAAKKTLGKQETIASVSGAASELKDFCLIASEGDDFIRATKLLAKIAGKTGPVGAYVEAQMGAGLVALQEGMKIISTTNTIGQGSKSQVFFNVRIDIPRSYWFDVKMSRAEALKAIKAVGVRSSIGDLPIIIGSISIQDDCSGGKAACYVFNFEYPDNAAAAYGIKLDLDNGQSVFASISELAIVSGEAVRTLYINKTLTKDGAILYLPR